MNIMTVEVFSVDHNLCFSEPILARWNLFKADFVDKLSNGDISLLCLREHTVENHVTFRLKPSVGSHPLLNIRGHILEKGFMSVLPGKVFSD